MKSPHQARYQVIERGRRLVTIDTATGQEVGIGAIAPKIGVETSKPIGTSELPDLPSSAETSLKPVEAKPSAAQPIGRSHAKLLLLACIGLTLFFLAIASGVWVVLVGAFIVPFTRPFALTISKELWVRIKNWTSENA